MARTGRFGRQPRSAPSLTNTLVAIAREYQNQRAQNIMDAWQKGGAFEGQKATDDAVLKFWREKAKGVSKDDPLYDTYQNAYTQLDYTINESKMTAGYALGKKSDGDMVAFYLNWSKKVPKDSEFYRVLQRDAGQYMRNQRATSQAAARRAAEEAYNSQQNETRQKKEAAGEFVIDTLRRIAQSGYADGGIAPAIDAPGSGSDLTDFDPNDPQAMLKLIAAIAPQKNNDGKGFGGFGGPSGDQFVGNPDVIFHDDDGKGWTGSMLLAEIGKLDPGFKPGAPFNVNYITGILDRQMQGLNERIARATKTGHMTDVTSLQKSKSYVALLNREVAAYPVQKAYQEARADYDAVVSDKSSSPQAVLNAWSTYQSTLMHLASDPRIEADDNLRSRLTAEANMQGGIPTLHESFTGLSGSGGNAIDSAENAKGIKGLQAQVEAVAAGGAVWTYGQTNANGVFEPRAGGREIGASTMPAVEAGGSNVQQVTVPDPRGGPPLTMMVTAVPVFASAKDPKTGEFLSPTNANPVAYAYDMPKGSGVKTMYGFNTKDGFMFSDDPPWDERLKTVGSSKGGNHLEVDLTPVVASLQAQNLDDRSKDTDFGNGFHVKDAKGPGSKGGQPKPGKLVFDPENALWSTDTRNGVGQSDPISDFSSLTLGLLMADEDGRSIATNLDKNPAFKTQIANDNAAYSGMQWDPKTGWVPGTGDAAKAARAEGQTNIASSAKTIGDFIGEAAKLWSRFVTGSAFQPTNASTSAPTSMGGFASGFSKLPTDTLQGTPFEALGNAFVSGTNQFKSAADRTKDDAITVKPAGVIKAPVMPDIKPVITQGPVPPTTSPTPPPQIGSTPPGATTGQTGSAPPTYKPPGKGMTPV